MMNFFKKHSTKLAFFIVNGLLITTGAMAISNQQNEKKNQLAMESQPSNPIEDVTALPASADENQTTLPSTDTTVPTSSTPVSAPTTGTKTTAPVATPTVKTTKTATAPAKSTKSTSSSTSTSAPKATPAPAPKPAPAKKTKTS